MKPILFTCVLGHILTILFMQVHTHENKASDKNNEDVQILQESIKALGPPRSKNYKDCNLPGPEVLTNNDEPEDDEFTHDDISGNYTLKLRAIAENFSYVHHYESGEATMINNQKFFIIKGQFTEIIQRKEGGYYLRTIGYINDKKSYHRFLVDVTKMEFVKEKIEKRHCKTRRRRSPIPPSLLASLVGGGYSGGGVGGGRSYEDC